MHKFIHIFFLASMLASCTTQKKSVDTGGDVNIFSYFKNNGEDGLHLAYSNDGYSWTALKNDSSVLKPMVGGDKLMRDPCIIRGADGKFHMVWTVSWKEKGVGYASSGDLVHWSAQQYLPVMEHEPATLNAWAPEIFYDRKKKEYLIFWASTIPGRFPETEKSGDDKYNHRMYYVTTKDFEKFSDTKLFYNQGFNVIDATIQQDGKRYVMFMKDETRNPPQKNLRVAFSDAAAGPYGKPSAPITGNYWAEGPTALKIGNEWLVYFDKYTQHLYGAVKSTDLVNWTDVSDKIKFPRGTRHGTVFTITKKEFEKLKSQLTSAAPLATSASLR
jgi:beta-xylosidase